jgi:hypothetical protein
VALIRDPGLEVLVEGLDAPCPEGEGLGEETLIELVELRSFARELGEDPLAEAGFGARKGRLSDTEPGEDGGAGELVEQGGLDDEVGRERDTGDGRTQGLWKSREIQKGGEVRRRHRASAPGAAWRLGQGG